MITVTDCRKIFVLKYYPFSLIKYGVGDDVRQKFTGYERDYETGLDFAESRYYNNFQGRFTAVDPLLASGRSANPQTFNRYAYVMNRPLNLIDPTGLDPCESRVSEYKQTVDHRENYLMTTSYLYDTLGRVSEVHYPAQYGLSGSPRKIDGHSFDTASRLTQMTYGGAVQASGMVFNAEDQTTEIKIGAAGTNQVTENYTFDPQTGLLTNQTATKNGTTTLLNLLYKYNRLESAGDSATGKKTVILTAFDHFIPKRRSPKLPQELCRNCKNGAE